MKIFVASVRVLRANNSPRCGLIYELYQRRLSADIDGYLAGVPAEYREELIAVARREFDYLTQDEIAEEIRQDRENDYCSHGIERNCCPLRGRFSYYSALLLAISV
ncbi:CcgAII protein [Escherichia coli]|nr:CcgAII protein [Escherichia coli]MCA8733977.1 CcgAII protein [Escherichia coli]